MFQSDLPDAPRSGVLAPLRRDLGLSPAQPEAPASYEPSHTVGLNLLASALTGPAMKFVLDDAGSVPARQTVSTTTDDNSDLAVRGDVARATYGASGAGIRVGILSDSFNLHGGYAADVASGNLRAGVQVLEEGPPGGNDEGRAMADLIHRIAPGAQLLFHTATGSESDFAAGITALAAAGANVIVDDVAYLDEPFFQDGSILQQAVEQVVAEGVSYFTSASNEGRNFYEGSFSPLDTTLGTIPGTWMAANFGTASAPMPYADLTIPVHGQCVIDLQWDQPFAGIGGAGGSANSLALALYTSDGQLVGTAGDLQVGKNPQQLLQFDNTGTSTGFRLVVLSNGLVAPPDLFKFIVYGNATIDTPSAGQGSGTVTGHELVAGANTVGAEAWSSTPRFGGNGQVEGFSSVGSGELLFNAQGQSLATPQSADKVSFVAPDGSMTSVFAPFYGTSAAAPDAAAVAALMLQVDPYLTPVQISTFLAQSAIPAQGPAGGTGAGLIQADTALGLAAAALAHH